jgi:hypothetical protein
MALGSSQAATINLIDLGGVAGSPAEAGFRIAAAYWGNMFTNNATINLGVKFAPLAPNVIGSTGSRQLDVNVTTWENRVNATKSNSAIDQNIVLPTLTNNGFSGTTAGFDGTANNNNLPTQINGTTASKVLYENSAVLKALGIAVASPSTRDGNVTFSSTFGFDFDSRDGVAAGTFDFLGVAIHEIGHALGFVSGVDIMDYYGKPNGSGAGTLGYDLNSTSLFSALDMFRYAAPGQLDMRAGGTRYFSIDGGQTALFGNTLATGQQNGDGRQASHWKDTAGCQVGNGIMDPTFCFGQTGVITGLDLAAFDAMGWNLRVNALTYGNTSTADIRNQFAYLLPEPGTWALMFAALGMMAATSRRRRS